MNSKIPIYPVEPWGVTETSFDPSLNYRNESVFSLSNGYISTRGTFEEGYEFGEFQGFEEVIINGFCDSDPIQYGECSFGFPGKSQTMLNLPNLKTTRVFLDDELFDMRTGSLSDYRRRLDLRGGVVTRCLNWTSPGGRSARVETFRFVSFAMKNIIVQRLIITPLDFDGLVRVQSVLDADVENHAGSANLPVDNGPFGRALCPEELSAANGSLFYSGRTATSGLKMACGSLHRVAGKKAGERYERGELFCSVEYSAFGTVVLDKFIAYASSLDVPEDGLDTFVKNALRKAAREGYAKLALNQQEYMSSFWDNADVEIDGDDAMQQGIRFNLFHVMQGAGVGGGTGSGAKETFCEGYEGHYLRDSEIYVLPLLIHSFPDAARNLLDYRYSILNTARARARALGHSTGALFPWRLKNGEECSAYVPPGTAQYHINADIAYAFSQYVEVTGDADYLKDKAAEVLCETARVWADVGCFSEERGGKYCIGCVTGPDEYAALVDNNFYTNLMARENLRDAVSALRWLQANDASALAALSDKIGLDPGEEDRWEHIADNMYLPLAEASGVYLPDDSFFLRKPWDDPQPTSLRSQHPDGDDHPVFSWRQRMTKQADSILPMLLHSDRFDLEEMARNYKFYQEFTLLNSTLSTCLFGIVAGIIGRMDEAYRYFSESARMDLDDHHCNVYSGIHAANMAGAWQAITFGFAGLRTNAGKLELSPRLPGGWNGYRFRITYMGNHLEVLVRGSDCSVKLLDGLSLSVALYGEEYLLAKGEPICVSMM